MPYTYNGIGTRYYGRKNAQTRPGICLRCNRQINLVSYDTILWFVVVYLPVIPLGRKRIIDYCPSCTGHRAMALKEWENAKQTGISSALEQYRKNPSPEAAIAAHRQLLGFHQPEEAAALQKVICEKFPDDAALHLRLAQGAANFGRLDDAEALFARALDLQPDSAEARVGVALGLIRHGQLDAARQLLNFLEQPGSSKQPGFPAVEDLALAYQKDGRHEEALQLFGRLLSELPELGQHVGFCQNVKKSEAALKRASSILPKTKFSLRRWYRQTAGQGPAASPSISLKMVGLVLACAAIVASLIFAGSNEYIRRHRTLFVVNQFGPAQRLEISGIGAVPLVHGMNEVKLPEGHYHAQLTGPVNETVDFTISTGYWERCFADPAWVLNPGGAAILVRETALYTANPQPGSERFQYHYGRNFEHFSDINHPFEALPEKVSLDSGANSKSVTGLQYFTMKPINAVYVLEKYQRFTEAADLAEWALRADPDNADLLRTRLEIAVASKNLGRASRFLRAGLTNRPVQIEWHRAYQQIAEGSSNEDAAALPGFYEDLLRAEPTNAALMYLAGRVAEDPQRAHQLFIQAHESDPGSPYPLIAQAYEHSMDGEWAEAKALLEQVVAGKTDDQLLLGEWVVTCLGAGKLVEAEDRLQAWVKEHPADFQATVELCDVLAAEGKRSDGEAAIGHLVKLYRTAVPENAGSIQAAAETAFYYAIGDFSELEKAGQRASSADAGQSALFYSLVEQNRLDEAARILTVNDVEEPSALAGMYLAYELSGAEKQAAQWRKSLAQALRAGNAKSRRAAGLIDGTVAPTPEAIASAADSVQFKALLVACLAAAHPESRGPLNVLARKLNADRAFPYHLINRATAAAAP